MPADAPSQPTRGPSSRFAAIDATRGLALLCVFLRHFADGYFERLQLWGDPRHNMISRVTMFASPTFMLISGIMLGYLVTGKDDASRARIRGRLRARALFLLVIGHPLIVLAYVPMVGLSSAAVLFPITDTIGISLLLGPYVAERVAARGRVLLGLTLAVAPWLLLLTWTPQGSTLFKVAAHALAGDLSGPLVTSYPLVPWFGVYLLGSVVGERLRRATAAGQPDERRRFVLRTGALTISIGLVLSAVYVLAKLRLGPEAASAMKDVVRLFSYAQKSPPSPAYLALYAGAALLVLGLFQLERAWLPRLLGPLALMGRTSLIGFILQFFVYYAGVRLLPLDFLPWPLYFLLTVALLYPILRFWDARGLNEWLTLRPPALERWLKRRAAGVEARPL